MHNMKTLLVATASSLLLPATPALAQDAPRPDAPRVDSSDIIVTARKREESILKVPIVENVISEETIQRAQIKDLQGVATKVPGLFVSPGVNTIGTLISLRGIGTSALDSGIDQSISLNIDGQQFSQGLTFKSGLFDLSRAEVLKGPQALFFGKNSPGGVIALTTADPQDFAEVIARVSYEFEAKEPHAELIVSGPVSDTLKLRLAGSWSDREGFFKNTAGATARPDLGGLRPSHDRTDGNENWIIRGTAVWTPSDSFSAKLKVNVTRDESQNPNGLQYTSCLSGTGPSVVGIPFIGGTNPCKLDRETELVDLDPAAFPGLVVGGVQRVRGVTNNGVPFLILRQEFGVLDLNYNITDDIMATSATTYYRNRTDGMISGTYPGAAASLWADNDFYRRDITEEIRIESDYADKPLNWLVGGYYQNAKMTNDIAIGWNQRLSPILGAINPLLALPPILDYGTHDVHIDSFSLFGQLRWRPVEQLEIAGGVRWTDETRGNKPTRFGAPVTIPKPEINSKNWSPELTITYTPTDDLTIFGALKQGYKSGSYQITTPNPNNEDRSFGDEQIRGGEIGLKARVLDRSMNINAAFYYYRLNGLQVGVSEPAGAGGVPITRTVNAGKSETYGIDFDATYRPPSFEGLSLNLSVNWNKAKFLELTNLPCYGGQTQSAGCNRSLNPLTGRYTARDESGTPLERAPEWQIIGGFDHEAALGEHLKFDLGSSVQYSSAWTSPIGRRADFRNAGFAKINASIGIKDADERWELALIGNNLNNVIRCGYGTNSDFQNTTVLTALAQTTGGVTNGPAFNPTAPGHIDEAACIANPGRQVFLKLTLRPLGLFQ